MKKTVPTYCVFIADDDADDRFLLQLAFKQQCPEARLTFAVDGLELFTALAESARHPCLIILDLNMPRLNGFEALIRLRQSDRYQTTPVVILTTSAEEQDRQQAYDLGANDYVVKPLQLEQLHLTVQKLSADWDLVRCK